ncbi:PhzF family phenazine biosynthesis protein [Actinokineospora sp. NPDC004072]
MTPYAIADVFTTVALQGNPVAVFTNATDIPTALMQRIAREMNLSETVFVLPPESGGDVRVRIFTPVNELPFAGHPTLGTAIVLASTPTTSTPGQTPPSQGADPLGLHPIGEDRQNRTRHSGKGEGIEIEGEEAGSKAGDGAGEAGAGEGAGDGKASKAGEGVDAAWGGGGAGGGGAGGVGGSGWGGGGAGGGGAGGVGGSGWGGEVDWWGVGDAGEELVMETGMGKVPFRLYRVGGVVRGASMRQPLPVWEEYEGAEHLLRALGLEGSTVPVVAYRNGPRHVFVGVADEAALAAVRPDLRMLAEHEDMAANCFAPAGDVWRTRMFSPAYGVAEDAATGSAAGPLALHLARYGLAGYGDGITIRQGVEMGRPSTMYAKVTGSAEGIERIDVAGAAVVVARGTFLGL